MRLTKQLWCNTLFFLCSSKVAWSESTQHLYSTSVGLESTVAGISSIENGRYRHLRDQDAPTPTPKLDTDTVLRNKIIL